MHTHTLTHFSQSCAWGNSTCCVPLKAFFAKLLLQVLLFGKPITVGHSCVVDEQKRKICCGNQKVLRSFKLYKMDLQKHLSVLRMQSWS